MPSILMGLVGMLAAFPACDLTVSTTFCVWLLTGFFPLSAFPPGASLAICRSSEAMAFAIFSLLGGVANFPLTRLYCSFSVSPARGILVTHPSYLTSPGIGRTCLVHVGSQLHDLR